MLLVAIPSLVSAGPGGSKLKARALLRPVGGSGVSGKVDITDDGSGVTVKGTATGLDPAEDHFSLFYDILSASTGDRPCVPGRVDGGTRGFNIEVRAGKPDRFDPAFISDEEMGEPAGGVKGISGFALVWDVNLAGRGRLKGTVDDVGLDRIRTISIRQCDDPGVNCDPTVFTNTLQACGLIVIKR